LAKPNYSFEKRQRDLEKKKKQEEKRLRKLAEKKPGEVEDSVGGSTEGLAEVAGVSSASPEELVDAGLERAGR
jgi:hypothetical protein